MRPLVAPQVVASTAHLAAGVARVLLRGSLAGRGFVAYPDMFVVVAAVVKQATALIVGADERHQVVNGFDVRVPLARRAEAPVADRGVGEAWVLQRPETLVRLDVIRLQVEHVCVRVRCVCEAHRQLIAVVALP